MLLLIVILVRFATVNPGWVEKVYATGFYPGFAKVLRAIFGWFPFSIGDILYLFAGGWICWSIFRFLNRIVRKRISRKSLGKGLMEFIVICLGIYVIFNIFWGLNYNRQGIAKQLSLDAGKIDTGDLKLLNLLLLQKLNESKGVLTRRQEGYPSNTDLFNRALQCYHDCQDQYPFLQYHVRSVKSSMFGWLGNYLGFTGYYDPFTGEAQVNTTVPDFIRPYTTVHEMAHQLGYAKEEEANFVGYLAATSSTDTLFQYSTYLDLFIYANRAVFLTDSLTAKATAQQLLPAVKADIREWRDFLKRHKNPLEPLITWMYGSYLRANQQPKGMYSYNEVIIDLIAYYRKFGRI